MKPVDLARWYFRLNGFFMLPNFILHPGRRGSQETDVDILGVRFPCRAEFEGEPNFDDKEFREIRKPHLILAEVTKGQCKLNESWLNSDRQTIEKILKAAGLYPVSQVVAVATKLRQSGMHDGDNYYSSLFLVGNVKCDDIYRRCPGIPQKIWVDVIGFIQDRLRRFHDIKRDLEQWDEAGKTLYEKAVAIKDQRRFEVEVRKIFDLPNN